MVNMSLLLAAIGFVLVMGSWTQYLSTVPRGIVPVWPIGSIIAQGVGFVLAVIALATFSFITPISAVGTIVLASFAILMAVFFYWLLFTQAKLPMGDLKVKVGDSILPFSAITSDGSPFKSEEMVGKRVLFKFFRGGW